MVMLATVAGSRSCLRPTADVIARTTDDAYYYSTSPTSCSGFGVTFDRMNPTNGFHPLWMLCMLPIYWAGRIRDGFRAVLVVAALVTGAGLCRVSGDRNTPAHGRSD